MENPSDKRGEFKGILEGFKSLFVGRPEKLDMADQKRRLTRMRCDYRVICDDHAEGENFLGKIVDMSLSGMRLEVPNRVKNGTLLSVTFEGRVPAGMSKPYSVDTVHTRVLWCRKRRYESALEVGVVYNDADDVMARSWVKYILRQLGFDTSGIKDRRKDIRVQARLRAELKAQGRDEIGTGEGNVVNLGAGGLLFESDVPVPSGTHVTVEVGPYGKRKKLICRGRIVQMSRPEKTGRWFLSVTFDPMGGSHVGLLGDYLRDLLKDAIEA